MASDNHQTESYEANRVIKKIIIRTNEIRRKKKQQQQHEESMFFAGKKYPAECSFAII